MKVLMVSGSRYGCEGRQKELLYRAMEWADLVILGGGRGVDTEAEALAKKCQIDHIVFMAMWKRDRANPRDRSNPGPARNTRMIDCGIEYRSKDHEVRAACFPGQSSVGTWDFIRKACDAGFPVSAYDLAGKLIPLPGEGPRGTWPLPEAVPSVKHEVGRVSKPTEEEKS